MGNYFFKKAAKNMTTKQAQQVGMYAMTNQSAATQPGQRSSISSIAKAWARSWIGPAHKFQFTIQCDPIVNDMRMSQGSWLDGLEPVSIAW